MLAGLFFALTFEGATSKGLVHAAPTAISKATATAGCHHGAQPDWLLKLIFSYGHKFMPSFEAGVYERSYSRRGPSGSARNPRKSAHLRTARPDVRRTESFEP
jgi:hypothetical protein